MLISDDDTCESKQVAVKYYYYYYYYTLCFPPPEGVLTLTQWWGLCGHMILRAILAVAYATGRASHAR